MPLASAPLSIAVRNNVKVIGNAGPTMVYAHGFGCNQNMWDRITPAFSDTHRQVLFDYVGSGKSALSAFDATRYASLNGYALDLIEVCEALALPDGVTLVCHSVSCSIGILASIARPELFARMILIGPNPCFLNDPPHYAGGFERSDLEGLLDLMDQNYLGWANYLAPVVSAQEASSPVTAELSDSFCSTDPVVAKVFASATFFSDNRADLDRVTVPTLILQHRDDALAPLTVGNYVHEHLKGSTLRVLEVSGHCAHMSHPTLVIREMQEFLNHVPPQV